MDSLLPKRPLEQCKGLVQMCYIGADNIETTFDRTRVFSSR
jgi:hypothetical protein